MVSTKTKFALIFSWLQFVSLPKTCYSCTLTTVQDPTWRGSALADRGIRCTRPYERSESPPEDSSSNIPLRYQPHRTYREHQILPCSGHTIRIITSFPSSVTWHIIVEKLSTDVFMVKIIYLSKLDGALCRQDWWHLFWETHHTSCQWLIGNAGGFMPNGAKGWVTSSNVEVT